ncbi:MAG: putative arsenical pump-driving ATPase signal peptide [Blastococcus sp.]|nr:putative arsenical pump-driving ATPase signal peptide [Blastococcus sp.]
MSSGPTVRTLLFTGSGGAGTSTLAAAAAVLAARSGRRTLLLTRQAPPVPGLEAVPGLELTVVGGRDGFERLWGTSSAAVAAVVPDLTLPPASSVLPLPGTADLALFTAMADADADLVVLDAGPVEAAGTLLALPTTLRWWLDQLLPPGARALGAVRTAAVRFGTAKRGPVDLALAAVPVVEGLLARDRLADAGATAVCLVAPPRPEAGPRMRGAATSLALHGLRAAAVLSRTLPADGPGAWWAARSAEQDAALAELAVVAPVHSVPEAATAPQDPDALADLLGSFELPDVGGAVPPAPERQDGGWRLTVALPFADRPAVELTRWQDDLVVTAHGTRRCLRLDPLLRRCEVTGGRLADPGTSDARLEVSFRPDPQLWPADLLPAGLLTAEERTS